LAGLGSYRVILPIHESSGALCLSRVVHGDTSLSTWSAYYENADRGVSGSMAEGEGGSSSRGDSPVEATIEPFLDMRDPTFRRILRAATSKFNQMICPLMASVCVRDLCMFWNDHSKSCYIVDTLKANLYHTICPKCGSTSVTVSAHEGRSGKSKTFRCDNCANDWSSVH